MRVSLILLRKFLGFSSGWQYHWHEGGISHSCVGQWVRCLYLVTVPECKARSLLPFTVETQEMLIHSLTCLPAECLQVRTKGEVCIKKEKKKKKKDVKILASSLNLSIHLLGFLNVLYILNKFITFTNVSTLKHINEFGSFQVCL